MKKNWRTINETLARHKQCNELPTRFKFKGETLTDPQRIADSFNEYLVNIGSDLSNKLDHSNSDMFEQYLKTPTNKSCKFEEVNDEDILTILNKLDNKIYDISNKILKYIKHNIIKPLALIINQMLYTGIFPNALKISKTIPLFKKGDASNMSNYRPISLLPTISKVFESVIYNQLYDYFKNNNLVAEQQYGFRAHHSTELAAVKLVDYINIQMDNGKIPVNIYLDLSKVFDTLDFKILKKNRILWNKRKCI